MADNTIVVDVVDKSVPELNPKNIAIINQPNPAIGVTVTGRQLLHLIQLPQYWITESATGIVINGRNIFQYFPELDPEGGGSKKCTLIAKAVSANGTYRASDDNADGYYLTIVDVPNTYTVADEGKVVNNGALISQTSMPTEITANNTYDTTTYNSVTVDVPLPVLIEKTITEDGVYNPSDDGADGYSLVTVTHESSGSSGVTFYDYDGSVVASYTPEQFAGLTELPSNPAHEGLTAQGWNWSLSDAKEYVAKNKHLNIGQMYITDDGKTRLYITLTEGRISPILQLYLNANSELDIDWGDNNHSTFTNTTAGYVNERHNYTTAGDYVIIITIITGSFELQSSASNVSSLLWNGNDNSSSPDIAYNNSIKKIEIGTGISSIGNNTFRYCYSLSSITIPDGVTNIGNNAFYGCYSLSSITIPDGVISISYQNFRICYSLLSVTLPNTITSIRDLAFNGCTSLSSITIPDSVTTIGSQAFYGCHSLISVTIGNKVTRIDAQAFSQCYSLASVTIPDSVTRIDPQVFNGCASLSSITIPDGVTRIDAQAFGSCNSLASITIPDTVTSIGEYAFSACYPLSSITIPNSVKSIGSGAFQYCTSLSSITIPDSVTTIGSQAFYGCHSLISVTIGNKVTRIDAQVFGSCNSLTSIAIPDSVTSIGNYAFSNCGYMESIKFTSTTPPTVSSSNAWASVPTTCIIYVPAGSLSAYTSATNYPNPSTFTYVEY